MLRGSQIVIPKSLRRDMIQRAHEGHLGIAKTKCRAREVIWWPGMGAQLETVVANCNVCARYRREQRREPLQVSTLPERPWQRVAADLFQLHDVHYLLVVDYYSRFPEVQRLSDRIVDGLKQVFSRHGIPSELHTDNGPQFVSDEFRQFARDYGFHHTTSSPHHPQGNGLVERSVQTIKGLLKKSAETGGDFYLALLAFRACPLEATTLSPAQLLMGRRLRTTLPSVPSVLQPELASTPTLRAKDAEKKQQQADHYNKRHGARVLQTLSPGDAVLVWDIPSHTWKIPATVQRQIHDRSYSVVTNNGMTLIDVTDTNYSSGAPGQTVRQTDAVGSRDIDGGQGVEEQEQEHRSSEDAQENTSDSLWSWRADYC